MRPNRWRSSCRVLFVICKVNTVKNQGRRIAHLFSVPSALLSVFYTSCIRSFRKIIFYYRIFSEILFDLLLGTFGILDMRKLFCRGYDDLPDRRIEFCPVTAVVFRGVAVLALQKKRGNLQSSHRKTAVQVEIGGVFPGKEETPAALFPVRRLVTGVYQLVGDLIGIIE